METQISVPIQTQQFIALTDFLRSNGDSRDPVLVVAEAIDYWMDNASWKSELLGKSVTRGYQWKELFLQDGTEVRMQYKGQYYYAKVEGDQLVYEGTPITPGSLANTIASSSRNAWRDLWIKRPSDPEWRLADDCRSLAVGALFTGGDRA
ncbi:hypothetical protein [Paraburkholderia sp. MM5384-R2]|uniref:hypothetical protein n=1 Tax=Paraburkholderia sp. MM5384-R2 TaxID=2723097 RepID=UPI0016173F73|nr:hypothetical protein [Paraburkholderia sp. MM5384-R2]MBB5496862.1 hypothetical protein [Paraburkholderia sp. MM5384-R2]